MSTVPNDIAEMAAVEFEPIQLEGQVTLQDWLRRASNEFIMTQCVRVVLSKSPEELTEMVAKDPDTALKMVDDLVSWQDRCRDGAETFGGAAARLMVALSRYAERAEPEGGAAPAERGRP